MFTLKLNDTFKWPITFDWPDAGRHTKQTIEGEFRRIETDQFMALFKPREEGEPIEALEERLNDAMMEIAINVDVTILGDNNEPITDPKEKIRRLLKNTVIGPAMFRAFTDGMKERERKN